MGNISFLQTWDIIKTLPSFQRQGKQWVACCPAHNDTDPSLSIDVQSQRILLHCHAGCHVEDVVLAMGLQMSDLFLNDRSATNMIAEDLAISPSVANPVEQEEKISWQLYDGNIICSWIAEPLVWIVENIIPKGGIGFMSAAPKDRKSLLALDLALHLTQPQQDINRHPWLNKYEVTQSNVLYIAREDPKRRIKERASEIMKSYGLLPPEPGRLMFLIRDRISLTELSHREWLKSQCVDYACDLLILDVLNRMIPDLDEISAKDMAKLVSILEELNRELGTSILCLDHTRKPQGRNIARDTQEPNPFDLKGSIAKYGCADFMISLARTQQSSRMAMRCENKDTDELAYFHVDVSPKDSGKPKFTWAYDVSTLTGERAEVKAGNKQRVLDACSANEWLSPAEVVRSTNLSRSTVSSHLRELFNDGKIECNGRKGKNIKYKIITDFYDEGAFT